MFGSAKSGTNLLIFKSQYQPNSRMCYPSVNFAATFQQIFNCVNDALRKHGGKITLIPENHINIVENADFSYFCSQRKSALVPKIIKIIVRTTLHHDCNCVNRILTGKYTILRTVRD